MLYGGVVYGKTVYCVLVGCTVCLGSVMCVRSVYYLLGCCIVL